MNLRKNSAVPLKEQLDFNQQKIQRRYQELKNFARLNNLSNSQLSVDPQSTLEITNSIRNQDKQIETQRNNYILNSQRDLRVYPKAENNKDQYGEKKSQPTEFFSSPDKMINNKSKKQWSGNTQCEETDQYNTKFDSQQDQIGLNQPNNRNEKIIQQLNSKLNAIKLQDVQKSQQKNQNQNLKDISQIQDKNGNNQFSFSKDTSSMNFIMQSKRTLQKNLTSKKNNDNSQTLQSTGPNVLDIVNTDRQLCIGMKQSPIKMGEQDESPNNYAIYTQSFSKTVQKQNSQIGSFKRGEENGQNQSQNSQNQSQLQASQNGQNLGLDQTSRLNNNIITNSKKSYKSQQKSKSQEKSSSCKQGQKRFDLLNVQSCESQSQSQSSLSQDNENSPRIENDQKACSTDDDSKNQYKYSDEKKEQNFKIKQQKMQLYQKQLEQQIITNEFGQNQYKKQEQLLHLQRTYSNNQNRIEEQDNEDSFQNNITEIKSEFGFKSEAYLKQSSLKSINYDAQQEIFDNDDKFCRICKQDEQQVSEPLISPCKCQKNMVKYVHNSCLYAWVSQNIFKNKKNLSKEDQYQKIMLSFKCELCKNSYSVKEDTIFSLKLALDNIYDKGMVKYNIFNIIMSIIALIVVIGFLISFLSQNQILDIRFYAMLMVMGFILLYLIFISVTFFNSLYQFDWKFVNSQDQNKHQLNLARIMRHKNIMERKIRQCQTQLVVKEEIQNTQNQGIQNESMQQINKISARQESDFEKQA
ncbi:hypothetical protein PPERSA_02554 [Pseudocohnilembus persalinus]|uniref:RING-CH-type domain-containing protein n=1 Tax=Pseudocohnilembus persalinus TaxID=266149 RepID=A0A0V0R5A9_PSEPJ|nr:hypothetical protein PPERSA_02554 [Pseudocohnilembus persalinus]|eukprot:KRX09682.1 hypothetical protein PPERSA_02554 [Pseudocohnilembus persalinus]